MFCRKYAVTVTYITYWAEKTERTVTEEITAKNDSDAACFVVGKITRYSNVPVLVKWVKVVLC